MINEQRWFNFSYCEQMGHIGSEISRARIWDCKNDQETRNRCLERALDLIDVTKNDIRLHGRRGEICYFREVVADIYSGTKTYEVSLADLDTYCMKFALAAKEDF